MKARLDKTNHSLIIVSETPQEKLHLMALSIRLGFYRHVYDANGATLSLPLQLDEIGHDLCMRGLLK